MVTRNMSTPWRTYSFILAIYGVLPSSPEYAAPVAPVKFVAPVNPCRPEDVICPVTCNLVKMSGSTDCDFCFCNNPIDSAWPDTTTTTTPAPSTTTTALPPGHSIVHNVHYVELKNPCVLSNAMCPLTCTRRNVTMDSGTVCERCECSDVYHILDGPQDILEGRRSVSKAAMLTGGISTEERSYESRTHQNSGHTGPEMSHHEFWNRPCMPFFTCPILSCPAGQHMPVRPNGCRICECVDKQDHDQLTAAPTTRPPVTTTEVTAPPTTTDPSSFLEMFCLPKADYCPSLCHVTNYRVGSWDCFHCTCPDGQTFVALQKPCNANSYVCPSNCSIRNEADSIDPTTFCQFCDCVKPSSVIFRKQPPPYRNHITKEEPTATAGNFERLRKFMMGPGHNTHVANSGPVQGGNGYDSNEFIPAAGTSFYVNTYETSSQRPAQVKTTSRPASYVDPESNCLTNAADCPTYICSLRTIGRQCHLCQCGGIYFRDTDVGKFRVLNTKTSLKPPTIQPATRMPTTPIVSTPQTTLASSTATQTTTKTTTTAPSTGFPLTQTLVPSIVVPLATIINVVSTSCYTCNETDCKAADLHTCASGKDYCMNTISQDGDGAREFSRECVGEEDCYEKWWIKSMNNPVCLGMYNTDKGPADQPEVCYFCCKGPSCNSAARIEDYNLYTGDDHVIG